MIVGNLLLALAPVVHTVFPIRRTANGGHTACSSFQQGTSVGPTWDVMANRKAERSAAQARNGP